MDRNSAYDQFVCRVWLSRVPLWSMLVASTYSVLAVTVERYLAIIHPIVYKVCAPVFGRIVHQLEVHSASRASGRGVG